MIKPQHVEIIENSPLNLKLKLTFESSLLYFMGHFDRQHLLPGVVQIGYVIEYAKEFLCDSVSCDIPQIKFTSPIIPGDEVLLNIRLYREKKYLEFEYILYKLGKTASKGKIKIL